MLLRKLRTFRYYANKELSKPRWQNNRSITQYTLLMVDFIFSTLKYKIRPDEYIKLEFYESDKKRKNRIITRDARDKFIQVFNKKSDIPKLENKKQFLQNFKPYINREFLLLEEATVEDFSQFYSKHEGFIAKNSESMQGKNIQIVNDINDIQEELYKLKTNGFDVIEELSIAHPKLKLINPNGLPPIRITTFIDKYGEPHIIYSVIYFSMDDPIINAHRGAAIALINPENGQIISDGMTPERELIKRHYITHNEIKGFQIPQWNRLLKMLLKAAKEIPTVRYVGWDVSISNSGPVLIEANAELPGIGNLQAKEWNNLDELYMNFELVRAEYNEKYNTEN